MGEYMPTDEERTAAIWCINNDVCITPRQAGWGESKWWIDIETGIYPNRKHLGTSPETYGPGDIWKKCSEYKLYYYKKYANKV